MKLTFEIPSGALELVNWDMVVREFQGHKGIVVEITSEDDPPTIPRIEQATAAPGELR